MELKSVEVNGFKRFGDGAYMRLDGKLIALVGPNEAGKTSVLTAISRHGQGKKFEDSDSSRFMSAPPTVTLKYFLSAEDTEAAGLPAPGWFTVKRSANNQYSHHLSVPPKRDLSHREASKQALDQVLKAHGQAQVKSPDWAHEIGEFAALLSQGTAYTPEERSELETLKSQNVLHMSEISDAAERSDDGELKDKKVSAYYDALAGLDVAFGELLDFEARHKPVQAATKVLMDRRPDILEFTETDRELGLPYPIRSYRNTDATKIKEPSKPLRDLMAKTGLDLDALIDADIANDRGLIQGLIDDANDRLRDLGKDRWSQSDAQLTFMLHNSQLDILVEHRDSIERKYRFNPLSERSAGYRQFIALQIFSVFNELKPGCILLIDEMEQHLHYDAQADLVQMLTREPRLGKVIYATHSVGCLPEDLGSGVKLVQWKRDDQKQSVIIDRFWGRGRTDGFSPLLFGMGAATLSFFPTRRALIGEGITETLLLPRLLREALEVDRLDFQVVHGLSNLSPSGIPMVDTASHRVAYVTDNDPGGAQIRDHLKAAGVPETHLLALGAPEKLTTLEDVIDEPVWLQAVNKVQIELAGGTNAPELIETTPATGRIHALPEALQSKKVDLAYAVLDIAYADPSLPVVSPKHVKGLASFGAAARKALELE